MRKQRSKKEKIIIGTIVLLVVGALLMRAWPLVGHYFSCAVVAVYLLTELRPSIKRAAQWRTIPTPARLKLVSTGLMVLVLASSLMSGRPIYFLMLVMLIYDLYYYEKR